LAALGLSPELPAFGVALLEEKPTTVAGEGDADGEAHLLFSVAERDFALPTANVVEIARAPVITPLPCAPVWLQGVAVVGSDVLAILDVRAFFRLPSTGAASRGRLIVVTSRCKTFSTGLLVDSVRRIMRLNAERLTPAESAELEVLPYVRGVVLGGRRPVQVLDVERFLASAELQESEAV
jgi:purine-binding chemotaxis protein CheW